MKKLLVLIVIAIFLSSCAAGTRWCWGNQKLQDIRDRHKQERAINDSLEFYMQLYKADSSFIRK